MTLEQLKPLTWLLSDFDPWGRDGQITLETRKQEEGPDKFAIFSPIRSALSKDLHWVTEPMASNQTAEHLALTRYDTPEEALEYFERWMQKRNEEAAP